MTKSLKQRMSEAYDQRLMQDTTARLEQERISRELHVKKLEIVTHKLITVAQAMDTSCEATDQSTGLPKYFVFDEFMVATQLFASVSPMQDISDHPALLAQFQISLVGIDSRGGSGHIQHWRIGTLRWLSYEGLFKSYTEAPPYLDFDLQKVKTMLGMS